MFEIERKILQRLHDADRPMTTLQVMKSLGTAHSNYQAVLTALKYLNKTGQVEDCWYAGKGRHLWQPRRSRIS